MTTDREMTYPPEHCTLPVNGDRSVDPRCPRQAVTYKNLSFSCPARNISAAAATPDDCCAACAVMNSGGSSSACTHWSFSLAAGVCTLWPGGGCTHIPDAGASSGKPVVDPRPGPAPRPDHNDTQCHADSYSTTLYGEFALQSLRSHNPSTPYFLYFPIQAVHTPSVKTAHLRTRTPAHECRLRDAADVVARLPRPSMTAENGGTTHASNVKSVVSRWFLCSRRFYLVPLLKGMTRCLFGTAIRTQGCFGFQTSTSGHSLRCFGRKVCMNHR